MDNFSHLFRFYFAVHNYSFNRYWELIIWPTLTHSGNEHQKTCQNRGSKYYSTFLFSIYTHTDQGGSAAIADIIFSLFLSSLAFFFFLLSMKDSCSHLTKMWVWLKAIRTTEFSKKLIVCKTQKLLNAPDITSLEDGKIRFQSKEKKFYCLEFF